jgi:hypothetical protein
LERRTIRGTGREVIDHPTSAGAADDLSNCVAGALVMVASTERNKVTWSFASAGPTIRPLINSFRAQMNSMTDFLRDGAATGEPEVERLVISTAPPPPDPDDPGEPAPDEPGFYRMKDIRNGSRIDGKPPKWSEIRRMVEKEEGVMKKWG